jgi:hypothetical protein
MGFAYCDCTKIRKCQIKHESQAAAQKLNFTSLLALEESSKVIEHQVLTLLDLEDEKTCEGLIYTSQRLVEKSRDTFWINANENEKDLCELETLALLILKQHVSAYQLEQIAGVEWWVQVKNTDENAAIDLHYDKDEDLAESFALGSFPLLSTVTYLTENHKANPTLVFPHRYDEPEGAPMESMLVSHPRRGKHLVFDGRYLHGAPTNSVRQSNEEIVVNTLRVTFLVNLWQKMKPCGIKSLSSDIRNELNIYESERKTSLPTKLEVKTEEILTFDVNSEYDLPKDNCERLRLPFVSKGATWVEDDDDSNLILKTYAPPTISRGFNTTNIRFGPGMEAFLEYEEEE